MLIFLLDPYSGGSQDWSYLHTNCFEITLELGCTKYPPNDKLPSFWNDNKMAMLKLIQQVGNYPLKITTAFVYPAHPSQNPQTDL